MIETVLILGLFGFAGGYLAGHALLWEDWRGYESTDTVPGSGWLLRKETNYDLYTDAVIAGDHRVMRWWWLAKGKFFHAITCAACAGWHAIWFAILVWVIAGAFPIEGKVPGFISYVAACAVHTFLMGVYDGILKATTSEEDDA